MVLGKLPVPGRPTILITVGQGPIALAVSGGGLDIFTLIYPFPSLWETARYRLKYCLKGPLNPKPTQPKSLQRLFCHVATVKRLAEHYHNACYSFWSFVIGGGWVVPWSWVNFQCRVGW